LPAVGIRLLADFLGEIQVIPADDRVLDQTPTSLGQFLFDLFAVQEVVLVAKRDGLGELIGILAFVQLLFNRSSTSSMKRSRKSDFRILPNSLRASVSDCL